MATRNIVPRADGEGNIGTQLKNWLKGWFKNLFVSNELTDGTNSTTIADIKDAVNKRHTQNTDHIIKDADGDTSVDTETSADEDKIRFKTGGSERVIIDENGNVGIGTTSPSEKLDVSGNILANNILIKVAEVEVSSDCTYVDFTGLDGNSAWFYILLATTRNPTSSEAWCDIFVNGDTDNTHYYAQKLHVCGTNDDKERHNDARLIHAYANNRGFSKAVIFKDPDGYFKWRAELILSTGSDVRLYSIAGSKTATIDNITSLRIQARISNAIGAGSKFILFKARRG